MTHAPIVALLVVLSQSAAGPSQPDPALIRIYVDTRVGSIDPEGMKKVFTTKVFVKPRKSAAMSSASRYSRAVD